jgi:hypothetical protein
MGEGEYEDEGGGDRERECGSMGTRVGNMGKGEHGDEVGEMGKGNIGLGWGWGRIGRWGMGNMRWGAWG